MTFQEGSYELLKRGYRKVIVPESRVWGDNHPTIVMHLLPDYVDVLPDGRLVVRESPSSTQHTHD